MYLRSFRNPGDANARVMLAQQMELAPNSALQRYQRTRADVLSAAVDVQMNVNVNAQANANAW